MTNKFIVSDVAQVISQRLLPSVTTWNRLEARPQCPAAPHTPIALSV